MFLKKLLIALLLLITWIQATFAQGQGDDPLATTKRDAFIILAMAGGGAILGLSTLSFVEEPSEHLKNIVVGASIGTIVGVAFVAYSQANKSKEIFYENQTYHPPSDKEFNTISRMKWHYDVFKKNQKILPKDALPLAEYKFRF